MKIGRKGFMLAEVIIVSVVIVTVLVTLYIGLNNVASAYDTRNRYYDVDCLYAAIEVNNVLLKNYPAIIKTDTVIDLSQEGDINSFEEFYEENIQDSINLYLSPYNKEKIYELIELEPNKYTKNSFNDYINYLSGNLNFNDDYDYIIIAERLEDNDINDCYYYALKLKYNDN